MSDENNDNVDKFYDKIVNFVYCDWCKSCSDCCFDDPNKKLPDRKDIQYTYQKPIRRVDSSSSSVSDDDSAVGSVPDLKVATEEVEPQGRQRHTSVGSYKGRLDSPSFTQKVRTESSSSSKSRTDSTSSGYSSEGPISLQPRRQSGSTPFIDLKPIEFWANRENVQPRSPRTKMPSASEFAESFNKDLYDVPEKNEESLTDEEKLARFKLGQIRFSLQYEIPSKTLLVKLIEAKDLPPPYIMDESRIDMAHSNPYCKITLLPDLKDSQQSSVQRKTQNPQWEEVFNFEIPYKEIQRRTLQILVKDFDKFSRHCIVGQVELPLSNVNLIRGEHTWKPLIPSQKDRQELGELLISMNYLPSAGRLNVDIIKAKQLIQTDLVGGSDPFVKLTLLHFDKIVKTKKTSIKKNTIDPVFNESFSFNVSPQQLESTNVVVSVWDHNSKSKDDFVGRLVLGRQGSGSQEVVHWNRVLQSNRSAVAEWHSLKTRQECDQASPASIAVA